MKKRILLLVAVLYFSCSFSQNDSYFIKEVLKLKPKSYFEIKRIHNKWGKFTVDTFIKLNTESQKKEYIMGQIYALNMIGIILIDKEIYKLSINKLQEALNLAQTIDDPESKSIIFNSLGTAYLRKNNIKSALFNHQYAVSEISKIKNPSTENKNTLSIAENNIGGIYLILKQYQLALDKFKKAKKTQDPNDTKGLALNYHNIGYASEKLGNIEIALKNYRQSLNYNILSNSKKEEIIVQNSICGIFIKQEKFKKALELAEKNYAFAKNSKDKYLYLNTINKLGWAYLKNNKIKLAKKFLKESITIAKQHNYTDDLTSSLFLLSDLYNQLNFSKKAFSYYKEAIETDRRISGEQNVLYINNLIYRQNAQIKLNQLKALQNETEIKDYEVSRNKNILIITLVSLSLLSVVLYSIYRQQLLNNERHILSLEQQALQIQMNPHFIFNALNSIKLYIVSNDKKQAVYYLNKFSKLIRNILDVSKVKVVTLKEELDTMDLYMSIENIRFDNEINYSIKMNNNLNIDTIKIPPLILQPFIENAIWHGLSSKKGEKKIILNITKNSQNFIEVSVSDNGVGREVANSIKKNKSLTRKSVGINLTIERLKTFFYDFQEKFSLKYYDLKDEKGNATGTKVTLQFPLI